jgi:hypothetical protein
MSDSAQWMAASAGVLGAAVGGLGSIAGAWLNNSSALRRERAARVEGYRLQIVVKRLEFQHETLISLQEAAARLGRAVGKGIHFNRMSFRETGRWGEKLWPDKDDEELRLAMVEIMLLYPRVKDGEIRTLANQMRDRASLIVTVKSERDSEIVMTDLNNAHASLNIRIGEFIRRIDDESDDLLR